MNIVLEAQVCTTGNSYTVTFEGDKAEDFALEFVASRGMTHAIYETDDVPLDRERFSRLADLLYPSCVHGMSEWLCEGPDHYPAYL